MAAGQGTAEAALSGSGSQIQATEGEYFQGQVATFSDSQPSGSYTATINWGDGTPDTPGTVDVQGVQGGATLLSVRGTHAYADGGQYTIVIVVEDSDGESGTVQGPAFVAEVQPPANPIGKTISPVAGVPFTGVVATFAPAPGGPATPSSYDVKIDWGDRTSSPGTVSSDGGGGFTVGGSHSFGVPGYHSITVEITGPAGSSIAGGTAIVGTGASPPACEKSVSFDALRAVANCLRQESKGVWVATGERVRVNGIDLVPNSPKARIVLSQKSHRALATLASGGVTVMVGAIPLRSGDVQLESQGGRAAYINIGEAARVFGFSLEGTVEARLAASGEGSVAVNVALPKEFLGLTASANLATNNAEGLRLDGLRIAASDLLLGGLQIKSFFIDFKRVGNVWSGGANLLLPSGYGIQATPTPAIPEQGFKFADGKLKSAGATIDSFPGLGLPVATGAYLNKIGFAIGLEPTRFLGNVRVSNGSLAGRTLARVDGSMFLAFATPGEPFTYKLGIPPVDRTFTSTALYAGGSVVIADFVTLGTGYALYVYPSFLEIGGRMEQSLLAGLISATADVRGFVDVQKSLFNAEVGASLCVAVLGCRGGDVIFSSKGVGGCVRTFFVDIGGGRYWSGGGFFFFRSCDVGRLRVSAASATTSAASTFRLRRGVRGAAIAVVGTSAAPRVTLISPSGERFAVPDDGAVENSSYVAFRESAQTRTAYFMVANPKAGRWTVETAAGSDPVSRVDVADILPEPKVKVRVKGRGRERQLVYRVRKIEGQRVTFAEKGNETFDRIGVARGSRGSIEFSPADGPKGKRKIVALIDSYGTPRDTLEVASYKAPGPRLPRQPEGVSVARKKSKLCVRFQPASGAAKQAALFRLSDGRAQLVVGRKRARQACVRSVGPNARGTVRVYGVRSDGRKGKAAKAKVAKVKKRRAGGKGKRKAGRR